MGIISMIIGLLTAIFVYNDAKKEGHGVMIALLWAAGSMLMPIIAVPLYLFIGRNRKQQSQDRNEHHNKDVIDIEATVVEESNNCPKCGNQVKEDSEVCPYCRHTLKIT